LIVDHPLAIEEEAGGDASHAISSSHSAVFIQEDGKCQAPFLSESLHNPSLFADIHGQDDETLVMVLFVSLL